MKYEDLQTFFDFISLQIKYFFFVLIKHTKILHNLTWDFFDIF